MPFGQPVPERERDRERETERERERERDRERERERERAHNLRSCVKIELLFFLRSFFCFAN